MSGATTQLIYVPNYKDIAEARLLAAWQQPKIRGIVRALAQGAQTLEDTNFDLIVSTGLDEATGDALDQWGELVGEERGILSDNEYRQFILARMLANRSDSTVDSLLEIFEIATQPNIATFHQDNFPAGFYLQVTRNDFMTEETLRRVARLMEDVRPGGRHMTLIEAVIDGFGFAGDVTAAGYDVGAFSRLIK